MLGKSVITYPKIEHISVITNMITTYRNNINLRVSTGTGTGTVKTQVKFRTPLFTGRKWGRSPFSHLSHPNPDPNSYPNLILTLNLTLTLILTLTNPKLNSNLP